ncbi:MAG: DUF3800 domain-containing protein [Lachnospiraceae bacterium]|nr:DUF3800 domain-containing protein [Lachnospiraceae bacterium]
MTFHSDFSSIILGSVLPKWADVTSWSTAWRWDPAPFLYFFFLEQYLSVLEFFSGSSSSRPFISTMTKSNKRTLSCFVDESGDFGEFHSHCPFYLVAFVLHDQSFSINNQLQRLENLLRVSGYPNHVLHCGPIIRREELYKDFPKTERRKLINYLVNFARLLPIHIFSILVKKQECADTEALIAKLTKNLREELERTRLLWLQYDKIILYYDNGQKALKNVLYSVFNSLFEIVDVRTVQPADYRLFQVADLVCSLTLIHEKINAGLFSKSERDFFGDKQSFKKDYWRPINDKRV